MQKPNKINAAKPPLKTEKLSQFGQRSQFLNPGSKIKKTCKKTSCSRVKVTSNTTLGARSQFRLFR